MTIIKKILLLLIILITIFILYNLYLQRKALLEEGFREGYDESSLGEATASLDSESEKKVHKAIDNIIKNRTVIIIAQRLSTIINADKIIVIDQGKIIEEGTHKELLELNKKYKKLYELQYNDDK